MDSNYTIYNIHQTRDAYRRFWKIGAISIGSKYAQVINKALKDCSCLVLLLTNASQNSTWVAKEVERAINYQKVIIPIQLEDLVLNDEFEFYISTDQLVVVSKLEEGSREIQSILSSVSACVTQCSENTHTTHNLQNGSSRKIHRTFFP